MHNGDQGGKILRLWNGLYGEDRKIEFNEENPEGYYFLHTQY